MADIVSVDGFVVEASAVPFPAPALPQAAAVVEPEAPPAAPSPPPPDEADSSDVGSDDELIGTAGHEYDEDLCGVCGGGESCEGDAIIGCDGCGVWVHQNCYGVPAVPEGDWCVHPLPLSPAPPRTPLCPPLIPSLSCRYCDYCVRKREAVSRRGALPADWHPNAFPTCMLCLGTGVGAYKECESRGTWVHVICATFMPETTIVRSPSHTRIT